MLIAIRHAADVFRHLYNRVYVRLPHHARDDRCSSAGDRASRHQVAFPPIDDLPPLVGRLVEPILHIDRRKPTRAGCCFVVSKRIEVDIGVGFRLWMGAVVCLDELWFRQVRRTLHNSGEIASEHASQNRWMLVRVRPNAYQTMLWTLRRPEKGGLPRAS